MNTDLIKMTRYLEEATKVMNDSNVSAWLRRALIELDKRDVLDALKDLEMLQEVLKIKWDETVINMRAGM